MSVSLTIEAGFIGEVEPGYLLGIANVLGVHHHIEFYRVDINDEGLITGVWHPECGAGDRDNENEERFKSLQSMYQGDYVTVRIEPFDGEYVCVLFPFEQ